MTVIAGLDPAIQSLDARVKPGHDTLERIKRAARIIG
jgi:hypothetical protein